MQKDDNFFDDDDQIGPSDEFGRQSVLQPSMKQASAEAQNTRDYFAKKQPNAQMQHSDNHS
jgi:hypothetical protein